PRILKSGAHDAAFYKNLWDTILAGKTWQGDICNQRKDGSLFWESATISGLLNDQSVVTHFIAVKQEITERVELNTRLQQRTRALEKLAEVVMDLNDCKSSETLFQMTVEGLVEVTKADRAALLTPDENHEVQFRAWKGLSEAYRKKVRGHFPWKWSNVQAQPIFIDDVSRSDLTVAIKSALKQEGVQSCGFFPLIGDQSLLGKIMVYYNKPHTFTAEEIHTLNILSRNVATILERLGTVHALEESTDRYRKLFDNAPLAIGIHQRGKWVRVNHYLVRMLGYSSYKDLIGQPVLNVVHPEERKAVQQRLQKMAETGEPALPREEKLVRRDGSTVIALVTSSPIMYRDEPAFEASGVDLTPLKHSLEALEESEARYENLLNSAPIGIAIHQEGKIVVANPYMAAMYGYSQEELIGKPIMDLLHPKSRKAIASRITAMEHDGEAVPLKEHLALHKDGSSFPVLSAGVPVTYRGRPAIEITVADLTPIKETEKALRESEAKYRSIFENSHEIIGITTVDGDFVDINPVAETILGYTREELLAMNTRDLYVDPDTGDRFIAEFKTRGYIGDFEARLRRKDGNILDCLLYATPRRDEEGRVIEFQGIIRDVTEQKKADRIWQTLRQLSRRLSDPLALDEIGPVVAEEARRLFDYDAFSLSIVDQETQMVEGFYNEDLLPGRREPSRVPTVRFPLQSLKYKALLTGKSVAVNRSAPPREKDIHQFGTRRYSRSLLYAPIMREQEMIGLVSVQSYTAGKFNEEDLPLLETFANSLSGAIRRAQQRKQLVEALEKAREGERVKTLFLANMSHEIRTPLNSILGFVQLIESSTRDLLPPEQQEFFDYVNDSAERLMRTVHEILDLSQIEAGAMKVQPKQLSVKRLCALVVEEQRPKAEEKGLTLVFKPTPAKDLALLDKNAFQQIVANLVDNAIKYTETGGITVTERVRKASILLDIKDTGIGIGDRYIRRMFEPFTQESEGYTKKFQGIGLGLALVKNYCELNQIHIAVTSEVGKGTVFTLTIPRVTTS
ncbi:MAG: PAS domain S-box protein, partial [Candidatus Neomarinimicrobiota bacterium]